MPSERKTRRTKTARTRRAPAKRKPAARKPRSARQKKWSGAVTAHSDALDLEQRVFTWRDPQRIARSVKQSAERSRRRKSAPFRSAMSMLTFYLNRAGRNLPAERRRVLAQAKTELRRLFEKPA